MCNKYWGNLSLKKFEEGARREATSDACNEEWGAIYKLAELQSSSVNIRYSIKVLIDGWEMYWLTRCRRHCFSERLWYIVVAAAVSNVYANRINEWMKRRLPVASAPYRNSILCFGIVAPGIEVCLLRSSSFQYAHVLSSHRAAWSGRYDCLSVRPSVYLKLLIESALGKHEETSQI